MEATTMARGETIGRKPRVTADHAERRPGPPRADTDAVEPTPHKDPNSSVTAKTPPIRTAAYSIREFCVSHRLSESMYFKLRNQGLGPVEMQVGRRRLISYEAASVWRREREVETATCLTAAE
jgi:hypothetical protein